MFITRLIAVKKAVMQLLTPFSNNDGGLADDTVCQDDDSGQGAQSWDAGPDPAWGELKQSREKLKLEVLVDISAGLGV